MSLTIASEKRLIPRRKGEFTTVEIPLTYPKGAKLVSEIFDINDSGFSFRMSASEGHLSPGTFINSLRIFSSNGKKPKRMSGVIKYARPFHNEGELCYKIGIEFANLLAVSEKSTVPFPIRPKRYRAEGFFKEEAGATFNSLDGTIYSGRVIDFSKYGAAIELVNEVPILRISDTLKDFRIAVDGEQIFSGETTVVRLEKIGKNTRLGVAFKESALDFSKAVSLQMKQGLQGKFSNFMQTMESVDKEIDGDFKATVADTRYFLEGLKRMLDEEDKKLEGDAFIDIPRDVVLKSLSVLGRECFYQKIQRLRELTNTLSQAKHEAYRAYLRHHLHPLLLCAPFLDRSYRKPLGFAGDYQTMNFLYKDGLFGTGLFPMFLDFYMHAEHAARAVMNRVPYLVSIISSFLDSAKTRQRGTRKIAITSIGCGPAKEMQRLIQESDMLNDCDLTLIDFDSEALLYTQEKILNLKTKYKREFTVKFVPLSVTQLLSQHSFLKCQDLICSVGLFDYLEESLARTLIQKLYSVVNEKGAIVVGNMDPSNDTKFYMEYILDWYLIYRTGRQMKDLASDLVPSPVLKIENEETGGNNFMIIQKP